MTRIRRKTSLATVLLVGLLLAPIAITAAAAAAIPEAQLQRALRRQQREIESNPGNAALWNDLGNLLMLGGWVEDAESAYKSSLAIDDQLVSARYNLALLYQQTHRPGRSKKALQRILRHHPDHAWSHYYLGVAHAETGKRKAAIRQFAHALRLDRDLSDPRVNPHVFDNRLMAGATLRAYSDVQGAQLAPRLYEDRDRVVRTMVRMGQLESSVEEPAETDEADVGAEAGEEMDAGEDAATKPRRRRRQRDDG